MQKPWVRRKYKAWVKGKNYRQARWPKFWLKYRKYRLVQKTKLSFVF